MGRSGRKQGEQPGGKGGKTTECRDLQKQQQRDAETEIPFARFVMKNAHAQQRAGTAAQEREQKERFFRDAPSFAPGVPLVRTES